MHCINDSKMFLFMPFRFLSSCTTISITCKITDVIVSPHIDVRAIMMHLFIDCTITCNSVCIFSASMGAKFVPTYANMYMC